MLNDSLTDALLPRDLLDSGGMHLWEAVRANNSKGAEGVIMTAVSKDRNGPKCGLISHRMTLTAQHRLTHFMRRWKHQQQRWNILLMHGVKYRERHRGSAAIYPGAVC